MQRNRQLGYTPIGLVDDDPRKKNLPPPRRPRARHDRRPAAHPARQQARTRCIIAIPSASGEMRQRIVDVTREGNVPGQDAAGPLRADRRRQRPRRAAAPGAGRGRARPRAGRGRPRGDRRRTCADETVLVTGAGGSIGSELCRQIARVGPAAPGPASTTRETALFEIERELRRRARLRGRRCRCSPTCKSRAQDAPGLRALPARRRLPRGGLQARAADGGEPARGGAQQRARDARRSPRSPPSTAPKRFVLISTDKAVNPKTVMGQSKALCEWIVEAYGAPRGRGDAVRRGALRQRARLVRQRDPDLPPPDRARAAR